MRKLIKKYNQELLVLVLCVFIVTGESLIDSLIGLML